MIRTRIKICGITNIEDANAAVEYGADALGFILLPESLRFVGDKTEFLGLLMKIPPFVKRVGVCRNVLALNRYPALFDSAQFYETVKLGSRDHISLAQQIYACRMKDETSLNSIELALSEMRLSAQSRPISGLVLDSYCKNMLGGTGETFNWDLAVEAKARFGLPIILAGGLTPDNVAEAVRTVRPYAVDVSSGVEAERGRKDHGKLKAFIEAVRSTDRS